MKIAEAEEGCEDYMTVLEIMEEYGIRKSYVYKLACVHNWRRMYEPGTHKPYVRYYRDDIAIVLGGTG